MPYAAPHAPPQPQPRRPAPQPVPEREQIALLEPFDSLDPGAISLVATRADAERAMGALLAAGAAGFDTESKPTFLKNEVNSGPHVIQFATADHAWLFQSWRAETLPVLAELIGSTALLKVGFGLGNDLPLLRTRFGVEPRAVLDLDAEFRRRGYRKSVGVKAAVALIFNRRFIKSRKATTSNWANPRLSEAQVRYAANDAYGAWRVYAAMGSAPP